VLTKVRLEQFDLAHTFGNAGLLVFCWQIGVGESVVDSNRSPRLDESATLSCQNAGSVTRAAEGDRRAETDPVL
jgi:hypothetical protein